ncbi:MAG TPA: NADH-quinone oxidoreductase subunit K, partial [Anaerolineaceae bacterium]|nr:NADH-quinone oxidoreductase subunit K [Anaerolineaceae bacterium]
EKGAMLAFVLVGRLTGQVNLGQSLALTVIVADTIVAVVGLTLAVQVRRKFGSLDIKDLTTLKR